MIAIHTPGPWLLIGRTIWVTPFDGYDLVPRHDGAPAEPADLRLMAAGPELYHTLMVLEEFLRHEPDTSSSAWMLGQVQRALRVARGLAT